MEFYYKRAYKGSVKLVIFDVSGTTIDYGCYAPAEAFIKLFEKRGVIVTIEQVRKPMGIKKLDHLREIAEMEEVSKQWEKVHGKKWFETDLQEMYEKDFIPLQLKCIEKYTDLIPGTKETVNELKKRGIKIGASSGYFPEAMDLNFREAKKQGYKPDIIVGSYEVPAGRPEPWMIYYIMQKLHIYPPESVVKVDDTKPGIEAGLNAGSWTIGISKSSNEVGLNEEEFMELPVEEARRKIKKAEKELAKAGAHYVVETIADIPDAILEIEKKLKNGGKP